MTADDTLNEFLAELNAVKFLEYKGSKDEVVIKADVSETSPGRYKVTVSGPGGRYVFGIAAKRIGMPEMAAGSNYWIQQVYQVYKRFSSRLK